MTETSDSWEDDWWGACAANKIDEDDEEDTAEGLGQVEPSIRGTALIDLNAKGRIFSKVWNADHSENGLRVMFLGGKLINCTVDRHKLAGNKVMRFVTKIASNAPTKGREKRQMIIAISTESVGAEKVATGRDDDLVEIGRTDKSYDDPDSIFAIPVRVACRKDMSCTVRVQVTCAQSNLGVGGEAALLGQYIAKFSDIWNATSGGTPLVFPMTSPACPRGSRAILWRLPFSSLCPPCSPFIELKARRHLSYSVPYLFWRPERGECPGVRAQKARYHLRPHARENAESDLEGPEFVNLVMARETTLESRFPYLLATLLCRPFLERMERAVEGWRLRLEHERIRQGFFSSHAEALKSGQMLVRLTVVAAEDLPLSSEGSPETDYGGLKVQPLKGDGVRLPNMSQRTQKLVALRGNKRPQAEDSPVRCHPFVAVTLEKPPPQVGLLIGHTNTEYATRHPAFGTNTNKRLCPHNGRPRESFSPHGAARIQPAPPSSASVQAPAFLFYTHADDPERGALRLEVFQESDRSPSCASFTASTRLSLESNFRRADKGLPIEEDAEVRLLLSDKAGRPAGRLLVRMAIFAAGGTNTMAAAPRKSTGTQKALGVFESPLKPRTGETSGFSAQISPLEAAEEACYSWMWHAGFSGLAPRKGDFLTQFAEQKAASAGGTSVVRLRYPVDWIEGHIASLTQDLSVLQDSLLLWQRAVDDGRGFRSSEHKMTKDLQGVPTNVHSQTFVVADLNPQTYGSSTSSAVGCVPFSTSPSLSRDPALQDLFPSLSTHDVPHTAPAPQAVPPTRFYYDVVSAGAPTAHALGYRRGGLLSHHLEMDILQKDIDALDQSLKPFYPSLQPTGETGLLCDELLLKLLRFEALAAKTAMRRILVLSQALGIATTSIATKLDIMLAEDADLTLSARTAENMCRAGFLICFQGLISTIGKEHGMLEDVAMAVEMASTFSFEICPKPRCSLPPTGARPQPPGPTNASPPPSPSLHENQDVLIDLDIPSFPSSPTLACTAYPSVSRTPMEDLPQSPKSFRDGGTTASQSGRTPPAAMDVEFDHSRRHIRLLLHKDAYERLPSCLGRVGREQTNQSGQQHHQSGVVVPIVATLFTQGIDAKQSLANLSNQLKKEAKEDTTAEQGGARIKNTSSKAASAKVGGDSTIQPLINRRSARILNDYCHRCHPVLPPGKYNLFDRLTERIDVGRSSLVFDPTEDFARSLSDISVHPLCEGLMEALTRENGMHKNVDLLREQERMVLEVGGGQVIFCKSGKDRTGMAITLFQARLLARHGCEGLGTDGLIRNANIMRIHGTRLLICDKNVGRLKFAFNGLQLQFMPLLYKPPLETVEHLIDSIINRDIT